jgi:uncharacterized protein YuzE
MTFSYDEDSDVLYVTFAQPKSGVRYLETKRGDVLRFCEETNQIVGVTIMYFAYRSAQGEKIEIPEVGFVSFSPAMTSLIGGAQGKSTH